MKKITFGILFLSLLLNTHSFAETRNDILGKLKFDEVPAKSTHWFEAQFDERIYCNSEWLEGLALQHGYQNYHIYHEPPSVANPVYLENNYYPPSSSSTQYISTAGAFTTILYRPSIRCGSPHFFKERVILEANSQEPDQHLELGDLFMMSYANYFNDTRGPRVESEVTFKNITNSPTYLSIMYLTEDGEWEVAKTLKTDNAHNHNFKEYKISTTLPFPTATALRITTNCNLEKDADSCRIEVSNIRLYSEECVPDQTNIGQCL
ncbi:hypothetical protein [Agarilytica rhodophyticola]|uniref:hypothetical protein n=1 Tax=Agarilytica rhodophyticola TaxID=1737490 RepID=UPI000B342BC9|nr:hypothetical protein [Agarilytica rhodophyticola]